MFGTYTVDENKKLVIFTVKASTFLTGMALYSREIVLLNASEFINENPGAP